MVRASLWTCVFLVVLRLAIGWHFFFEGVTKLRSQNASTKPFSSQAYFGEAEGPLGPKIREELGDPDLIVKAKLKLNDGTTAAERMPTPIAEDWRSYVARFKSRFQLSESKSQAADDLLETAETEFVRWRTYSPADSDDAKTRKNRVVAKKDYPNFNVPVEMTDSVPQRVQAYEAKLAEIRNALTHKNLLMGKDVEKTHLRDMKADAAKMRADFDKDIEAQTTKLKEALAKLVDARSVGFQLGVAADDPKIDQIVLSFLTLQPGNGDGVERMPEALGSQWDAYAAYVKQMGTSDGQRDPARDDEELSNNKLRWIRYLQGKDEYTGEPRESEVPDRLKAYRAVVAQIDAQIDKLAQGEPDWFVEVQIAAVASGAEPLRQSFLADIKHQTELLKTNIGGFTPENLKGILDKETRSNRFLFVEWPTSKLGWLDAVTPWTLCLAGACLLAGLFTRLACFVAGGFLVMEYLSQAAFPWLPKSPMTEGNYLFVNKNVIEFLALMALAGTRSGRWFGLDGLVGRLWPFRRRPQQVKRSPLSH